MNVAYNFWHKLKTYCNFPGGSFINVILVFPTEMVCTRSLLSLCARPMGAQLWHLGPGLASRDIVCKIAATCIMLARWGHSHCSFVFECYKMACIRSLPSVLGQQSKVTASWYQVSTARLCGSTRSLMSCYLTIKRRLQSQNQSTGLLLWHYTRSLVSCPVIENVLQPQHLGVNLPVKMSCHSIP